MVGEVVGANSRADGWAPVREPTRAGAPRSESEGRSALSSTACATCWSTSSNERRSVLYARQFHGLDTIAPFFHRATTSSPRPLALKKKGHIFLSMRSTTLTDSLHR